MFQNKHNSCCPVVATKNNPNTKFEEPWLTKGLQNACEKKNTLCKSYLIKQDKTSKRRYKTYKNNLTTILRKEKKIIIENCYVLAKIILKKLGILLKLF